MTISLPYDNTRAAFRIFALFAFAYLLSAALRSVNAVLAPELTREFNLSASSLGLLSSVYFLGFMSAQLPLGVWLDRYGPRRVEAALLCVALAGIALFATAQSLGWLIAGRFLFGVGVSACLMAPYTGFRAWFRGPLNARLSSWMLTSGSLGMICSSLPVQWALPFIGWRLVFWVAFALVACAVVLLWFFAPRHQTTVPSFQGPTLSYREIFIHPQFIALAPFLVLMYGGLLAFQTLWIGPWLTQVTQWSAAQAAWGILAVHAAMGLMFVVWGALLPRLMAKGTTALHLITRLLPIGFVLIAIVIVITPQRPAFAGVLWALSFAGISVTSLSQITLAQSFPAAMAGRVNTASNLLIFGGAFAMQWFIGGLIDGFASLGLSTVPRFQASFAIVLALMIGSWAWYASKARVRL
jgi:predicted MFS family arabinose efflux permease